MLKKEQYRGKWLYYFFYNDNKSYIRVSSGTLGKWRIVHKSKIGYFTNFEPVEEIPHKIAEEFLEAIFTGKLYD